MEQLLLYFALLVAGLLLCILFVLWLLFRRKPGKPDAQTGPAAGPARAALPPNRKVRAAVDRVAGNTPGAGHRAPSREEQIARQRQRAEEKRRRDEEEKRKSLETALERNREEDERRRRLAAREARDSRVGREFHQFIGEPVPRDVQRSMQAFLAGEFTGSDRSPLAYVGYRVGKTNGLPNWDRERRMKVCFRIDIPKELRREYRSWAGPGSRERLGAMCAHLRMLAAMRRGRPGYEVAVSEWERDEQWLRTEFGDVADRFSRHGVTW